MATRTPTTFTAAQPNLDPRQPVLAENMSEILDDQQFVLEKDEMVIGDMFAYVEDNAASGAWTTLKTYYTLAPDLCGTASTIGCQFSFYVWSSAVAAFDIAVYHVGSATRYSYTVSSGYTTPKWRPWASCTIDCDGTVNELQIQHRNSSGTTFLHGVAIFTGS